MPADPLSEGPGEETPPPRRDPAAWEYLHKEPSPRPIAQQLPDITLAPPVDPNASIGLVDHHSSGLLPTRMVLDLAGLNIDDKDKATAARRIARQWDLLPQVVFGEKDPAKLLSRATGQPVSMADAMRFSDRFAPVAIASMLDATLGPDHIVPQKAGPTRNQSKPVEAKRVAAFANAIGRGTHVDLGMGLAVAVQIADKETFSARTFEHNLEMVRRWAATGKSEVPADARLQIAITLSRKGKAKDITDVNRAALGSDVVKATKEQETYYREQARQLGMTYEEYVARLDPNAIANDTYAALAAGRPPGATGGLADLGPDYWKEVEGIQTQVRLDQEAFQRSPLGKVVGAIGFGFQKEWEWSEKALGDIGLAIITPVALGIAAVDPNSDIAGTLDNVVKAHQDLYRMINEGRSVGDIVQEGWGYKLGVDIPDWTGLAFDFWVGSYFDAFGVLGKYAQVSREARALTEVAGGKSTVLRNIATNIPGVGNLVTKRIENLADLRYKKLMGRVERVGDSSLSSQLFKRIDDEGTFFRHVDFAGRGAISTRTLDHSYMGLLRRNILTKYALKDAEGTRLLPLRLDPAQITEARAAFGDGMKAQFFGYGPVGSVAESTVLEREFGSTTSAKAAADAVAKAAAKPEQLVLDLYDISRVLEPTRAEDGWHFFTKELPGTSGLGRLGPRRAIRSAITSPRFTETGLGKRMAALPNINPGRKMPLFGDDAWSYVTAHSRRWSTFSETEVQHFAQQAREILTSGTATETNLVRLAERIDKEATKRILKPYNLSKDAEKQLVKDIFEPTNALNRRIEAFGAQGTKEFIKPVMESQLRNFIYVADPVKIREALRDYTGSYRRMKAHLLHSLGQDAPEISKAIDSVPHHVAFRSKKIVGGTFGGLRHIWKALTVARPAYIPRVILGDENLRFLTTTNSVFERLAAQEWWGITRKLDDTGAFSRKFYGIDGREIARVGMPGALERNANAVGQIREAEVLESILASAKTNQAALQGVSWKMLKGKDAGHLDSWAWDLSKQFGNSAPGQVALRSVAAGESVERTQVRLLEWAKQDNYRHLSTRIGVKATEAVDWSNDLARMTHGYTMGSKEIAEAALSADARDLRRVLDGVPMDKRPPVHGPTADGLVRGQESLGSSFLEFNYRHWVRNPEARMNRHPFFKSQKRRAEEGMLELVQRSGVKFDDVLRRSIDEASTEFALEQVNKVMFDLTKQSRFTELLQFVFPFPQPFFEGFQAWGHLIRRNPAIIARAQALFKLGKETGFIQHDDLTGDDVIPLAPVAGLAKVLAHGLGMDGKTWDDLGIRFVAPLSSLNMLTQTTVRFGSEGILGKLAGGVSVPVPGMRPELAQLMQWAFKDTTNEAAISYLFQYGPSTQFLPRSVQAALAPFFPTGADKANEERLALSLLRAYQVQGIGFNADGTPISEEDLLAQAHRDARALSAAKTISALFSPASPRVQTAATKYEELFQTYITDAGDDFTVALDRWTEDHPDLWMIPVGKTYYTGAFTDPRTGEELRGPRLPAARVTLEMLNTPGIGEVMKRDKAWAGLLLLGVGSDLIETQDFPTFARLVSDGSYRYKTPEEFLVEGESRPVWKEISDFYTTVWNPGLEHMDTEGIDTSDTFYTDLRAKRQRMFATLYNHYPMWVRANLDQQEGPDGEVIWDWPGERKDVPTELVLASARQLASTPGMQHFPGVVALNQYLELRDKTAEQMLAKGYRSITQDNATDLAARFARGVTKISEATPGFDQYLSQLLGVRVGEDGLLQGSDDLQKIQSATLVAWSKLKPELRPKASAFDSKMEVLASAPYEAGSLGERSKRFLELTQFADAMYEEHPEVVKAWWDTLAPTGQRDYRDGLLGRTPEFYTRWDWHVMGYKLDADGADIWRWIAGEKARINKEALDAKIHQTDYDKGAQYDWLNQNIAGAMKSNPAFAKTVERANDWTFPFTEGPDPLVEMPGKAGQIWTWVTNITKAYQDDINKAEMFGPGGFGNTDEQTAWYLWQQHELRDWVAKQRKSSPAFDASWKQVQSDLGGDPLIGSVILPDSYYGPLGAVGYG